MMCLSLSRKNCQSRQSELDTLTEKVVESGLAVWAGGEPQSSTLIVSGQSNLLENVQATDELERMKQLFDELERKKRLDHTDGTGQRRARRAPFHWLGK